MNRLWLTPSFRFAMRRIVPVVAVLGCVGLWAANDKNRAGLAEHYAAIKGEVQNRPEFMVNLMAVDGASEGLAQDIREAAPVDFPISSFDLDLEELREQIEGLDAVSSVGVRVRSGGILQIDITERTPAVVWRNAQGLELLDAGGHRVAGLTTRVDRTDLPLIAGPGADRAVGEALMLLQASGPLMDRLRGVVRIGERRWNLVLDNDQTIMLPEVEPFPALAQVIALTQSKDLLTRDVRAIDMRNPNRPTLRVSEFAQSELRRLQGL
jgi:cell division protein FtsQ